MISKKRILKTGLIFGIAALIGSVINFFSALYTGTVPFVSGHLVDIVIIILSIVGSIYFFKKFLNEGELHIWQGIALGFWTMMVAINLISLFHYIYLEFINPQLLNEYKEFMAKDFILNKEALKKEEMLVDAQNKLDAFAKADATDVVIHQLALKFLPFPIIIFAVFFSSLALRKVEK